jgi:hypothetical protein
MQRVGLLVSGMGIRFVFVVLVAVLMVVGCDSPPGYNEQNLPVSPDTFKPYSALFSVDRTKMGFPPLPTNGTVRILTVDRANWKLEYAPPNYDVSFQIYEGLSSYPRISRFIALKRDGKLYKWVSEQIMYTGPKLFTPDGSPINEYVTILCETEQVGVIGTNIHGIQVIYSGPDEQLAKQCRFGDSLTVTQVGLILRAWGYNYEADKAVQTQSP